MRDNDVRGDSSADDETEPGFDVAHDPKLSGPAPEVPHRQPGSTNELIDTRYRVERLLGRGAMGEVYLAHDQRLGRQVALKLVRASSPTTALRLQVRLEREALALARVAHPNVVGIHDVGTHAGQTYLTMQFVPGTTLREWQPVGRKRDELIDACLQAGRGLAAAHSVGVVHRDFKPDNVIVGDDGVVRVLDFGLAAAVLTDPGESSSHGSGVRAAMSSSLPSDASGSGTDATIDVESGAESGAERASASPSERMTQVGSLVGTLAYMSSEQLEGRSADARSDQFGFCVAMWEALTGSRPFASGGILELILNIEQGPRGGNGLPRWLRSILVRGLQFDPQRRWPGMTELIHAIERGRTRGRKVLVALGLPATIGAAILLGRVLAPAAPPTEDTCTAFVGQIDARWSPTQRAAIASHAGRDAEATAYAIASLDELAHDWRTTASALCESPGVEQPLERECLLRWLDGFAGVIELLGERGDEQTLARAPDLLAQLRPPDADYCALGPTRPVDPEVWRLTERARALAVLGDLEAARELADAGLARADKLPRADGLEHHDFSRERALAHAAQAEVAVEAGDTGLAMTQFGLAQRNALAADLPDVLLATWTTMAKLLVHGPRLIEAEPELALVRIEQAEPLLFSLHLDEHDSRRAELIETRGLIERARGNHQDAIARHREAQSLFIAAGQPTLASKSLVNIGVNHQDLGDTEQARHSYTEALALLDAAKLPSNYRRRVRIERNLGLLALASTQPDVLANGITRFEFVLAHGNESERFEAHELILALVLELDDDALTRHWVERALAALDARPQASEAEAFRIQRVAGIALAYLGDPRGEALLAAAERSASSLPLLTQFNLHSSWVEWLEQVGRCSDAHERRDRLAALVVNADAELADLHAEWRASGPTSACVDFNGSQSTSHESR
jgi:serine/threonine protein kinase/tetratricopeptide (TPR) repeat protein